MVGVRLPAAVVRQVDKMAAEIGADRSMIIRLMVEYVLEHGSLRVRTTRSLLVGGCVVGKAGDGFPT
jgi:metal-responsive CopG/Arc/MetJ family transcriptional regulator